LLPTTAAMGFLLMIGCTMPSGVVRGALLMGVREGGEDVRMVLLSVWGLDVLLSVWGLDVLLSVWGLEVITLYGDTCLLGLGEILSKDFCCVCRRLCGITIIWGPLLVCIFYF